MGLLDGGLKTEIGLDPDILAIMLDGTLTHKVNTLVEGRYISTDTDYSVKGFYDTRRGAVLVGGANTVQGSSQRIALILAEGLPVIPKSQDAIIINGEKNAIDTVEIDPAGATYTLVLTQK